MGKSILNFEAELRISHKPMLAFLMVLSVLFVLVGARGLDPSEHFKILLLGVLGQTVSAIAWWLDNWKPKVSRWFTIAAVFIIVNLGSEWLGMSGFLTLKTVPVALAAVLISIPAAVVVAVGETVAFVFSEMAVAGASQASVVVTLTAVWSTLGVMYSVYRPVYQLSRWLWEYFQREQCLLEEARDRKAELEQALDDLVHTNRQLSLANERMAALRLIAEEAQKTKAAFVAKVSHEFRTPLNMIIGLIDLLAETPEVYGDRLPSALLGDLRIVHRNCEHLSSMIDDVLDLSQAEVGRLALHREGVDLSEVIEGALAVVYPLLDKKGLDLQVSVPGDLPEIYCDRTRIRQVILNLLSNAARFTEEGGITLRVVRSDRCVIVSVADTGLGIPPEDVEMIFEPFSQSTNRPGRTEGGSGLGLSISKQFVELHGGRIWLESELGIGTTFSFELPICSPMEHATRPGHWIRGDWVWVRRTSSTSRNDLSGSNLKRRVVICDETGALYPMIARYSNEIEFMNVGNLTQAIQELQQCPAHALILNMPSSERLWSVVERARLEAPDTPVIGCSVFLQGERALRAGATDYLIKPVRRAQLELAIQAVGKPVKQVLVVDDDPDVLQLLTRMLRAFDDTLEIVTALSGEQALDELRSSSPDLVLLDILMPDMDGWQVLKRKGQDDSIQNIPVILVSAQDPVEQPVRSQALSLAMGAGLSLNQLLRCSLGLSELLLSPESGPDPVPG